MNVSSFIQHEVLNLLTLIQMLILNEPLAEKARNQVSDLIKLSSMLIANPEFFETKKREFFIEDVDLGEVIEIVLLLQEESFQKNKISAQNLPDTVWVKTDKTLLKELLEGVVKKLTPSITSLDFQFSHKQRKLKLRYSGEALIVEPVEPLEALRQNLKPEEIILQILLAFAEQAGIKVRQAPGEWEFTFA